MHIADAAALSGLSEDTIRFYDKSGMLPVIGRDARGWRDFSPADIDWLRTLFHLRATEMPLEQIKRFAQSAHALDSSAPDQQATRLAILRAHAERLAEKQASLDACKAYLTHKIDIYTRAKETEHDA